MNPYNTVVGIDVGGTFTDLYLTRQDGTTKVCKVPSTPNDPSEGLMAALLDSGAAPHDVNLIVHGTTIATNAVIERKGAKVALITTRGFRDVLELGRRDRPSMYGLTGVHRPLIPRELRFEVSERMDAKGHVVQTLDETGLTRLAQSLLREGVDAIVVSFLHAYANPAHEARAEALLLAVDSNWEIVTSHSVCNQYFEFERTSTAVVQGYLQPLTAQYAQRLNNRLHQHGFECSTLIMQSSGGVVPLSQLSKRAAHIVRSGPAAGVMAAATLAADAGYDRVITGDMGGTSYDVAVVIDGIPKVTQSTKLDFRIPLQLPMIDVHTIGAGGGSIASIDGTGILQVGPQSAGARPGPVCYGHGGTAPTVTDANLVLGRIDWRRPIGTGQNLDIESARRAIAELGEQLSLDMEATAEAILTVVNQTMAGRTRLLSVEQGLDPRNFALVSFGGAGPLHGAALMREVGISTLIVPPSPGVLCALGCCTARARYDFSKTIERTTDTLDINELIKVFTQQSANGVEQLRVSGAPLTDIRIEHSAIMSYAGQIHALRVPLDSQQIENDWTSADLDAAFDAVYHTEFGNTLGDIQRLVVGLETTVSAAPPIQYQAASVAVTHQDAKPDRRREVYFGRWIDTAIFDRTSLKPGMTFIGPAIVEQDDATTIIDPELKARVDVYSNLIVEVNQ